MTRNSKKLKTINTNCQEINRIKHELAVLYVLKKYFPTAVLLFKN